VAMKNMARTIVVPEVEEIERLHEENARLKILLSQHGISWIKRDGDKTPSQRGIEIPQSNTVLDISTSKKVWGFRHSCKAKNQNLSHQSEKELPF